MSESAPWPPEVQQELERRAAAVESGERTYTSAEVEAMIAAKAAEWDAMTPADQVASLCSAAARYAARRIRQQAAHWHAMFIVALEDEDLITEAEGDTLVDLWDGTQWGRL